MNIQAQQYNQCNQAHNNTIPPVGGRRNCDARAFAYEVWASDFNDERPPPKYLGEPTVYRDARWKIISISDL